MNLLKKKIIETIGSKGPITFESFMGMALYYPGLGYYTSPDSVIGRKGDFYTSSHLHPIFGAMIARQLMEMWEQMGMPEDFHAIEVGGGAGYLCKDILNYLRDSSEKNEPSKITDFLKSLKYVMVEINPEFQKIQKKLLGELGEKVKWIKSLNVLSHKIRGCILSNELLDAFPVHIVEMRDGLKEVFVNFISGCFMEQIQDVSDVSLIDYTNEFSVQIPEGYRTEINLKIRGWLKEISSVLSEGFLLTIDYGYSAEEYYGEERAKGTLLCYYDNQYNENPYKTIGNQDITAHVNFSSLKKWGDEAGLNTIGYSPQGTFLISSGIDDVITELYSNSPDYTSEISKIKGLILPQGLGESHKVMIQHKGKSMPKLRGFSMQNQAGKL
ncbi:MAG: hypothetical protein H6Q95_347 [Nitrospirae bacterium]|nr:hypothetical protein [Nitrospirota bacterium]